MGLCKCRTVTNLFCFEHRKNVCETCIQSDHTKCIVRSYLQWLQDSDFDPVCMLCRNTLATGEVIRLSCLDLFHVECVNEHCNALPSHTAPAGYACPSCKTPIIPAENSASSIAKNIWATFKNERWSQHILPKQTGESGFGTAVQQQSVGSNNTNVHNEGPALNSHTSSTHTLSVMPTAANVATTIPRVDSARNSDTIGQQHSSGIASSAHFPDNRIGRKPSQLRIAIDPDDKKYKRRGGSVMGIFEQYLPKGRLTCRKIITYVLLVVVIIFLGNIILFSSPGVSISRLPTEVKMSKSSEGVVNFDESGKRAAVPGAVGV
ncbi:hypothetical protein BATDEDRAFT_34065 [Batrachochytrium dendrobatidis JAM81]|uniref:RING-type domain-containing protein n=1 Tax=Batrachochytrium dendrobatidis (strain JAM81 / FGSC 10211) TaxID=684364 RepID=F4NV09_BATDJ|nr:uncharacterized protein BATDEDRAFT_34065 [Batrachochytrium dendrobatidis JAM81]EGF84067.1 hypothetical protein BATDEDRAFT_34065 [Batrachochytrium dendrobatidis JAM81]|eukprot:XP_006675742.1 hypothetical protein BATDEDRAFT_34065 [Batrachochytrium dendrobatidis JAM81]